MITLSGSTGAVGALATYFTQLAANTSSASGSGAGSDEANALITLVKGADSTGSGNLATLLGTTTTSTDSLLTQISSLASSMASGSTTVASDSDTSSDTSGATSTATQTQVTKLLTSAYSNQLQGILLLL